MERVHYIGGLYKRNGDLSWHKLVRGTQTCLPGVGLIVKVNLRPHPHIAIPPFVYLQCNSSHFKRLLSLNAKFITVSYPYLIVFVFHNICH